MSTHQEPEGSPRTAGRHEQSGDLQSRGTMARCSPPPTKLPPGLPVGGIQQKPEDRGLVVHPRGSGPGQAKRRMERGPAGVGPTAQCCRPAALCDALHRHKAVPCAGRPSPTCSGLALLHLGPGQCHLLRGLADSLRSPLSPLFRR